MAETPVTPRPAATTMLLRRGGRHSDRELEVLMVRRAETQSFMPGVWVFPGGMVEDGEEYATCAIRELEEETGCRAGNWRKLASFFTAPGFANERMHLYLATQLSTVDGYKGPAPDESLELEVIHWRDALRLAQQGGIRDAKTLVGLLWFKAYGGGPRR
jgi:ADP-ribose pyrophosphatase